MVVFYVFECRLMLLHAQQHSNWRYSKLIITINKKQIKAHCFRCFALTHGMNINNNKVTEWGLLIDDKSINIFFPHGFYEYWARVRPPLCAWLCALAVCFVCSGFFFRIFSDSQRNKTSHRPVYCTLGHLVNERRDETILLKEINDFGRSERLHM